MSSLIDLTRSSQSSTNKSQNNKNPMQTHELQYLLEEIAKNTGQPKVQVQFLKTLLLADIEPSQITQTDAKRFCHKLSIRPMQGQGFNADQEQVKLLAKDLIKKWGKANEQLQQKKANKISIDALLENAKKKMDLKQKQTKNEQYRAYQIATTGYNYRDKMRVQLVEMLRDFKLCDRDSALSIALQLEDEIHKQNRQGGKPYADRCRSLIFNLSDPKNPKPRQLLLQAQVSPVDFLKLSSEQLASETQKQEREQFQHQNMQEKRTDWAQEEVKQQGESYKGIFACESCGSTKTGFIQVQIDRADEPMHCFIFCYDCKARFMQH